MISTGTFKLRLLIHQEQQISEWKIDFCVTNQRDPTQDEMIANEDVKSLMFELESVSGLRHRVRAVVNVNVMNLDACRQNDAKTMP